MVNLLYGELLSKDLYPHLFGFITQISSTTYVSHGNQMEQICCMTDYYMLISIRTPVLPSTENINSSIDCLPLKQNAVTFPNINVQV